MLKLTQPHISMNNMFPPINPHSRPPSEDLRGVVTNGTTEIHSASKQQQIRRQQQQQQQQTMDQQRRSPLRSNSLLTSTASRYVTAAAAAAAAVPSPSVSVSPLVRSPSFVQNGTSAQFEPAKIIYRSSDYGWNDHQNNVNASNQPLRASSPIKNKIASARHLTNGTLHESTAVTTGTPILHIPTTMSPQQNFRDDMNNGDLLITPTNKTRHTARFQRTNSHLDKAPTTAGYALPMRSESYRSSRLDYGMRVRHTSSKQRNYVTSKTSFHEVNNGDFYLTSTQDENIYYHHQQPQQINLLSSTQRLNGSTLDITASRKPLSPNRTSTFNVPVNGTVQHNYFTSSQEIHRSETNIDRNMYGRFTGRGTTSKEQIVSTPKYRHSSTAQTTSIVMSNTPGERHPSAQSYKSRDPNISYAYTDVKKYIEENDLMSPEKEQIIRNWVMDVEKHRHHLQKFE